MPSDQDALSRDRPSIRSARGRIAAVALAAAFALLGSLAAPPVGTAHANSTPKHDPAVAADGTPFRAQSDGCAEPVSRVPVVGTELAAPVGTGPCPGVRPGAIVRTDLGSCTMNFAFHEVIDGSPTGAWYMATAGHCILAERGEEEWPAGKGPPARDSNGNLIGKFRYAVYSGDRDFAAIRLEGVTPNPRVCHFGGPTGWNHDTTSSPTVLHHYGQGLLLGAIAPGRTATAPSMNDNDVVWAAGAAVFGDSGSPAISADGRAVGVVVALGVGFTGNVLVTRLGPQIHRMLQKTGVQLVLATATLN